MNQALIDRAKEQPELAGMATTLTAAYTVGTEAFISHVGDSRAYLYHEGKLTQMMHDHTLGTMPRGVYRFHPARGITY